MTWHAHVTVATIVERDGKFLMVEELADGEHVLNQPAGHLDPDETLFEAALRETLEETQWRVELLHVVGFTLYKSAQNGITYYRTSFAARPIELDLTQQLDTGIERAVWLNPEEINSRSAQLRSPMVLSDIQRYLNGEKFPLQSVIHL
ncbi:ADP-ribose pyrophosphatase YjhB (NUDIX family) [Alteromonadaceae bacterium 2753L.S.0a.02]|nr:ADP-ribose pyrophosphatase YjhB (NUDIX family) [Alteromonadaceae bacterium 2753L.S.0a.02]